MPIGGSPEVIKNDGEHKSALALVTCEDDGDGGGRNGQDHFGDVRRHPFYPGENFEKASNGDPMRRGLLSGALAHAMRPQFDFEPSGAEGVSFQYLAAAGRGEGRRSSSRGEEGMISRSDQVFMKDGGGVRGWAAARQEEARLWQGEEAHLDRLAAVMEKYTACAEREEDHHHDGVLGGRTKSVDVGVSRGGFVAAGGRKDSGFWAERVQRIHDLLASPAVTIGSVGSHHP